MTNETQVKINKHYINETIKYLATKPYQEVFKLIPALQTTEDIKDGKLAKKSNKKN